MRKEAFCEVLGDIDDRFVQEAREDRKARKPVWRKWGAAAACVCLVAVGSVLLARDNGAAPDPDRVQIPNPIIEVASAAEMEDYLDFDVPVLEKEVASYSVLVEDAYPVMGQIQYADGSEFRMQYGSGDISGIHGGTLEETGEIDGVSVAYYRLAETAYAVWEQGGFSCSYVYADGNRAEVEDLIRQLP